MILFNLNFDTQVRPLKKASVKTLRRQTIVLKKKSSKHNFHISASTVEVTWHKV